MLGKNQHVVGDADARAVGQRHGHDHALVVDVGAIAAAEVDELVLPAIVAADDGVLPGNQRAETQAHRILPRAPDGRRISDGNIEGVGLGWLDR